MHSQLWPCQEQCGFCRIRSKSWQGNGRQRPFPQGARTMDFRQAKPVEEPVPSRERASPTAHVFNLSFSVSELGYCAPAKTL